MPGLNAVFQKDPLTKLAKKLPVTVVVHQLLLPLAGTAVSVIVAIVSQWPAVVVSGV